ncbi:MAG: hypothetical protein ACREBU_17135 [Nitrososphaera sp.]
MAAEEHQVVGGGLVEEAAHKENEEVLMVAPSNSKFVKVEDYMMWVRKEGIGDFEHDLEVETDDYVRADYRVITGIGVRLAEGGNLTTLRVAYGLLDNQTGRLSPVRYMTAGREPHHELEVWIYPAEEANDDQVILCGLGARAEKANITTLRVWTRDILPDGTLARPIEQRYGSAKDNKLEAQIMVPDPGVIVGVGMRADPGNVTHLKAWFGHLKTRQP